MAAGAALRGHQFPVVFKLHGLLRAGLALIVRLILFARRRSLQPHRNSVETTTLYWHLVDVVWVVLYPLIYLVGRP